jgi:hypothetical protein
MLTTIVVTRDTRDRLKQLGKKGETYEHILRKLLDSGVPND